MKKRETWFVQNFLARRKQQVLRRWMRKVETLSDIEKWLTSVNPRVGEEPQ
jgi:hypothetical protein